MKKSLVAARCMALCFAFVASMVTTTWAITGNEKALNSFQHQCLEILEMVSAEMGDDTTLGERVMQVYGWVLDGTHKPKQYAKERAAFVRECRSVWRWQVSPELYDGLMCLNTGGKKYAGMERWKKAIIGGAASVGLIVLGALLVRSITRAIANVVIATAPDQGGYALSVSDSLESRGVLDCNNVTDLCAWIENTYPSWADVLDILDNGKWLVDWPAFVYDLIAYYPKDFASYCSSSNLKLHPIVLSEALRDKVIFPLQTLQVRMAPQRGVSNNYMSFDHCKAYHVGLFLRCMRPDIDWKGLHEENLNNTSAYSIAQRAGILPMSA